MTLVPDEKIENQNIAKYLSDIRTACRTKDQSTRKKKYTATRTGANDFVIGQNKSNSIL